MGTIAYVDWIATLTVLVALVIGASFTLLQMKTMRQELQIARQERDAHPIPDRGRQVVRSLAVVSLGYGVLGVAFFLGWRQGGVSGGALAVVALASLAVLVVAALAIKSAWVSRR